MRVLTVSTSTGPGGAGRGATRLHEALLAAGVDSEMRVLYDDTHGKRVTAGPAQPGLRQLARKVRNRWSAVRRSRWSTDNQILHEFGDRSAGLVGELNSSPADILHLHWVCGMLSNQDIGNLRKPIVWTLHDMWAFCGGEAFADDQPTARFRAGYRPDNRPGGEQGPDLNKHAWDSKRVHWAGKTFNLVSPSHWLARCAEQSMLFSGHPVHVIPNPINTGFPWRPVRKDAAKEALGLPIEGRFILAGADGGIKNKRKGGSLLREALAWLAANGGAPFSLVVYGQSEPSAGETWPCRVHWLGKLRDETLLALAYSAADVMAVPSTQDNLPYTAVEAQACGLPVVAFDIGGLADIVVHGETGYLAKPFDTAGFAEGIQRILADEALRGQMAATARHRAETLFARDVVARRYIELYQDVLSRQGR